MIRFLHVRPNGASWLALRGLACPHPRPEAVGQVVDGLDAFLAHGLQRADAATPRRTVQEIGHPFVEKIQSRFEVCAPEVEVQGTHYMPLGEFSGVRTSSTTSSPSASNRASASATLTSVTLAEAVGPSSDGTVVSRFPPGEHPAAMTRIDIRARSMGTISSRRKGIRMRLFRMRLMVRVIGCCFK